jgi:hypothetical protein
LLQGVQKLRAEIHDLFDDEGESKPPRRAGD